MIKNCTEIITKLLVYPRFLSFEDIEYMLEY